MKYQLLTRVRNIWYTVKPHGELTIAPNYTASQTSDTPVQGHGGWGCEFDSKEEAEQMADTLETQTVVVEILPL